MYFSFLHWSPPLRNPCTYNTSVQGLIIKGTTTACLCDAHEKATIQAGGCTLWGHAVFAGISPPRGAPPLYREVLSCILYQGTYCLVICSWWFTSALTWEIVSMLAIRLILEVFTQIISDLDRCALGWNLPATSRNPLSLVVLLQLTRQPEGGATQSCGYPRLVEKQAPKLLSLASLEPDGCQQATATRRSLSVPQRGPGPSRRLSAPLCRAVLQRHPARTLTTLRSTSPGAEGSAPRALVCFEARVHLRLECSFTDQAPAMISLLPHLSFLHVGSLLVH